MHQQKPTSWKDIEAGLGSVGRLRIIRRMLEKKLEYFTKYALQKGTGLKPVDVRRDLEILVNLGWVVQQGYDPQVYRINPENEMIKLVAEFFRKVIVQ